MFATLDQARALDALARAGTYAAAAKLLSKQHSAVVYAVQQLESQTELQLLDRSGYRTKLTPRARACWSSVDGSWTSSAISRRPVTPSRPAGSRGCAS